MCILRYRDESGSYHTHDSDGSGRVDSDITHDVVMQTPVLRDQTRLLDSLIRSKSHSLSKVSMCLSTYTNPFLLGAPGHTQT